MVIRMGQPEATLGSRIASRLRPGPDPGASPGRPDGRRRARALLRAAILLLVVTCLLVLLVAVASSGTLAADPTSSPAPVLSGGDLRSEGSGPGIVGSPLGVLLAVMALGLATALLTVVVAKLASRR
jgi:hypothetical protein